MSMKKTILEGKRLMDSISTGRYGEKVASYWLKTKSHEIIARNLRLKQGEIDILALKNNVIHIIEVKTIRVLHSNRTKGQLNKRELSETTALDLGSADFLPEDNFSKTKLRKLQRLKGELLLYSDLGFDPCSQLERDVQIGGIAVYLYYAQGARRSVKPTKSVTGKIIFSPKGSHRDGILTIEVRYFPFL